ncbi:MULTISPECIES: hypothetical protein [unclassified Leifsonia]|uniref:peptidoglycan-binding domain-containing protein n=1 Tax=unclassified Leifsonia TaxID=2663824 RepID=UPI0008A7C88F|nr:MULTISPECIES: hypothetical protein [unclassified Leifsonia]SEI15546.1 hypothetical protein SAMN04515694_1231 [Leifsonia sp. CL154]SFL91587.1 hypothetical protein SAMN04515692_11727 [Leifsonia sp. CL147]
MKTFKKRKIGWTGLVLALVVGAAAVFLAIVPDDLPASVRPSPAPTDVALSTNPYTDDRAVEVQLSQSVQYELLAARDGRVTGIDCSTEGQLVSGSSFYSLNGTPVVTLATTIPLWRDLKPGDRGADVVALQQELVRLGYNVTVDGGMGRETLVAANKLGSGEPSEGSEPGVPVSHFTWIPASAVYLHGCNSKLGDNVAAGTKIATVTVQPRTLQVINMPTDLVPGKRKLEFGTGQLDVDGGGKSAPLAQSQLSSVKAETATADSNPSWSATLKLSEPIDASVVPPSAVVMLNGSRGCVSDRRQSFAIEVIGSQLGQTFVRFVRSSPPTRVLLNPNASKSCQ